MPEYIFLTHEHFDHIWGVNLLKEIYNSHLICSLTCSQKIVNKKKNMSIFYNQVGFEIYPVDIIWYLQVGRQHQLQFRPVLPVV